MKIILDSYGQQMLLVRYKSRGSDYPCLGLMLKSMNNNMSKLPSNITHSMLILFSLVEITCENAFSGVLF